jgi:methylglutaconyl-CoA hydratase
MNDTVLYQIDADGIATVTLNRPEVHNAFDPAMVAALTATLKCIAADRAARAVVLTGAGRSFCAGADIAHMRESAKFTRAQNYRAARLSAKMFHALYALDRPVIACVRGAVRGGGVGLVSACDIAVASRDATFRLSEVKIGVIPAMISPYVIGAIGERMARRYMLTGEEFGAEEARRIGLVHEVADEAELGAAMGRMLAQLKSSGPRAVAAIKRMIPSSARAKIGPGIIEQTARAIAAIRATPEAQEGLSAFLEKRRPVWTEPAAGRTSPATRKLSGRR